MSGARWFHRRWQAVLPQLIADTGARGMLGDDLDAWSEAISRSSVGASSDPTARPSGSRLSSSPNTRASTLSVDDLTQPLT